MTLQMLRCFVAIVESKSFAQAASQLYITQPAITQQLQALETDLNTTLLDRTKHPAELTPAGYALYSDAKEILYRISLSEDTIRDFSPSFNDTLFIGCQSMLQLFPLPDIYQAYYEKYPDIYLNNIEIPDDCHNDAFSQPIDVAFLMGDIAKLQKNVTYTSLYKGQFVCVVSIDHPFASRKSVSMDDLEGESLVLLDTPHCAPIVEQLQTVFRRECVNTKFYLTSSSIYAIYQIAAKIGIAIMPDFQCPIFPNIKMVPFETNAIPEYGIAVQKSNSSQTVKNFIKITKNVYKGYKLDYNVMLGGRNNKKRSS